jgi:hypothetical protein
MEEWKSSTEYKPGDYVIYLGNIYRRSQYPPDPTTGTNPHEEVAEDSKGEEVRSWELIAPSQKTVGIPFNIGYFSILASARSDGVYTAAPPYDPPDYPGSLAPKNPYVGPTDVIGNAYGLISHQGFQKEGLGITVEWDQDREETPATEGPPPTPLIPWAPVMPEDKCGVALQQFEETLPFYESSFGYATTNVIYYMNLEYSSTYEKWIENPEVRPRTYYAFLLFNHPLYFRRTHVVTFRTSTYVYTEEYTIPGEVPVVVPATHQGEYFSEDFNVTPTDNNYASNNIDLTLYIQPNNAVLTYVLPDDIETEGPYDSKQGTIYEMVEVFVKNVESN